MACRGCSKGYMEMNKRGATKAGLKNVLTISAAGIGNTLPLPIRFSRPPPATHCFCPEEMPQPGALVLLCLTVVASSAPINDASSASLMPRVNLSAHGPEVSRIALGILHLAQDPKVTSVEDARVVLQSARAAGITTFDLADNYAAGKCLELFGAALQSLEEEQPGWRAGIQVIAKIGELDNGDYAAGGPLPWLDTSMAYTQNITDYYLRVMGTSYLDLLIYHWPDRLMDPHEVAATFRALKDSGKVRFFGVSNFKPLQLKLLSTATQKVGIEMVTNEVAHSPWTPQTEDDGTLEDAMLRGIRPLAWGPLGGNPGGGANFLFKVKWPAGSVEAKRQKQIREMLRQVSQELGATEDVVALAWSLRHPAGIVPIIGSMNITRIGLQALHGPKVALRMTRKQWWQISDVSGVGIWGGALANNFFVPPTTKSDAVTEAAVQKATEQCIADDKPCTSHGGNDTPCMELGPDSFTDDNGPHNTVMVANKTACCAAAKTARTKVGHAVNWWTWNPSKTSPDGTCDIWTGPDSWKSGPGIRNPPVPRSGYENSMSGWSRPPIPPGSLCCPGSTCFRDDTKGYICVHQGDTPNFLK